MNIAQRVSKWNRDRKWATFLKEIQPQSSTKILDVGFSEKEYSTVANYLEKHYPYQKMITALGIKMPIEFIKRYPNVSAVHYNGEIFPFKNKSFDVVWSNAVIEHVGNKNKQILFLKEIKRVAQKSFITTPNKYFPLEVHTYTPLLHYLPKNIFDKYLVFKGKKWAAGDYMHLLSLSEIKSLLAESDIKKYRIIKNRIAGLTIDFIILF